MQATRNTELNSKCKDAMNIPGETLHSNEYFTPGALPAIGVYSGHYCHISIHQHARIQILAGNISNGKPISCLQGLVDVSQMFVFGEVQDPNPETVNLVEDIVRSQVIELVNNTRVHARAQGLSPAVVFRFRRGHWPLDVERDIYLQKTSYS
jgi:Transcription initiation factor IID, 18kD subunit